MKKKYFVEANKTVYDGEGYTENNHFGNLLRCTIVSLKGTGSWQGHRIKTDYDKGQDKPHIWDGDIFKLGIILKNVYDCIGMKNNSKGVTLNCLYIPKNTFMDPEVKTN